MITCTAIFDIGKTNKKFVLFNEAHRIEWGIQTQFEDIKDEDGFDCEDLTQLTQWMRDTWRAVEEEGRYRVKALNFATHGAGLVHLDDQGQPVAPLYSYLKPFPDHLQAQFYRTHGDRDELAAQTASPPMGMLNSGLQLYWLKHARPDLFARIRTSLHFPSYCAYVFSGNATTEYTSVGCHTALWDFARHDYHRWVYAEGFDRLFPPFCQAGRSGSVAFRGESIPVGTGLHDSSAALIPYLRKSADEPFLLLSTGTWGIALNPFAQQPLTVEMLLQDCLNFFTFEGKTVRASRLFIGDEHQRLTERLARHFRKPSDFHKTVRYDGKVRELIRKHQSEPQADLERFDHYEEAYHYFIQNLVDRQAAAIRLAAEGNPTHRKLFVDGGFCKNDVFVRLLALAFPTLAVETFEEVQGTALGAAMVMETVTKRESA